MSVEQRKQVARTPSSKRAPRSPEKRRKITKAIAAKWADPVSLYVIYIQHLKFGDLWFYCY